MRDLPFEVVICYLWKMFEKLNLVLFSYRDGLYLSLNMIIRIEIKREIYWLLVGPYFIKTGWYELKWMMRGKIRFLGKKILPDYWRQTCKAVVKTFKSRKYSNSLLLLNTRSFSDCTNLGLFSYGGLARATFYGINFDVTNKGFHLAFPVNILKSFPKSMTVPKWKIVQYKNQQPLFDWFSPGAHQTDL